MEVVELLYDAGHLRAIRVRRAKGDTINSIRNEELQVSQTVDLSPGAFTDKHQVLTPALTHSLSMRQRSSVEIPLPRVMRSLQLQNSNFTEVGAEVRAAEL